MMFPAFLYDVIFFFLYAMVTLSLFIILYFRTKKEKYCQSLGNSPNNLIYWRYSLYSFSISLGLYWFSFFNYLLDIRFLFFFLSLIFIAILLSISLPSWLCKKNNIVTECNCDYYKFRDFVPVIACTVIGASIFFFLSVTINYISIYFMIIYALILCILFFFTPKKDEEKLHYPPELFINSIGDLQTFLITDIDKRKIIFILKSGCEFCQIQVNELTQLGIKERKYLRILDFSESIMLDPFVFDFLNISPDKSKLNFPTGIVIESGINSDIKEGVMLSSELAFLLK